jgi:hypothetical protein
MSPFPAVSIGVIATGNAGRGHIRNIEFLAESRYQIEEFRLDSADSTTHRPSLPSAEMRMSHRGAVLAQYRAFVGAIRSGSGNPVGGRGGRLSLAVALAAETAVSEKRLVDVAELLTGGQGTGP